MFFLSLYSIPNYNLPFNELKTQAFAKNPTPTAAKPQPETSRYLKAPRPIKSNPITIIIKVAHPRMVFLFIPIIVVYLKNKYREF